MPVSARQVNRIVCDAAVEDYFWSDELPVVVSHDTNNVFVKFKGRQTGERMEYPSTAVDLHVVCGGAVYTMILQPRDMDSATIRLGAPEQKALDATLQEYGALPFEEKVKRLTLAVYRDQLPPSFRRIAVASDYTTLSIPNAGTPERLFQNVIVHPVARVSAPGLGLAAIEYELITQVPNMAFTEGDFLLPQLSPDIVAITVQPLLVPQARGKARLIIVERNVGASNGL